MRGGSNIGRKRRLWYPGAIYHVVARGNRKEVIFRQKDDYKVYMKFLKFINEKYPFKLYSYCLMSNHVHLQIATLDSEIWKIMKGIHWLYSMYFNSKYDLTGHLFQGRYYADLIENESHLLQTSKYIHLNPVKAGIVDNPIDYPWSSYGVFMGLKKNDLVDEKSILGLFQNNSRKLYREYVESEDKVSGTFNIL